MIKASPKHHHAICRNDSDRRHRKKTLVLKSVLKKSPETTLSASTRETAEPDEFSPAEPVD
jgi:hypothetical protein